MTLFEEDTSFLICELEKHMPIKRNSVNFHMLKGHKIGIGPSIIKFRRKC